MSTTILNVQTSIHNAFNASNNETNKDNTYTPPAGLEGLRIKKTVYPDREYTFNQVFEETIKGR